MAKLPALVLFPRASRALYPDVFLKCEDGDVEGSSIQSLNPFTLHVYHLAWCIVGHMPAGYQHFLSCVKYRAVKNDESPKTP